ncbi:hypothetical protein GUJ93_ZPchr0006g42833 [Zizania palustris]|uniref:RING-type E3 ubiquitin transferase n=1 Tax=Zizania palustris TaxID=103762 RepID=A0A8J5T8V4_ZIZPA|nr:hypothetical protein GUJ93_ZPchr0006g42833 [Zizania palustris]
MSSGAGSSVPDSPDDGSAAARTATSNFTLLYVIIAVLVGVVLYMAIRYWRAVLTEWRMLQAGAAGGGRHGEPHAALLGLSADDIDALPTFTYRARAAASASPLVRGCGGGSGSGKGRAAVECVVCLQELADGDVVRVLPACRHFFHGSCIDLWLRAHSTCPVCRAHPEPEGGRLSEVTMSPPLPQLRRCGLSPERTTASKILADILQTRSPLRGNSSTGGSKETVILSKSPSPVQTVPTYAVSLSPSPTPSTYHSLNNERWSNSPPPQVPEVVVVRSKSPSPSPIGFSRQTSARSVGVAEGVDAITSPSQAALSKEGGGSPSPSPSPVPH